MVIFHESAKNPPYLFHGMIHTQPPDSAHSGIRILILLSLPLPTTPFLCVVVMLVATPMIT